MARDESKRDCSTCVYGDNGTNPDGCPETCLEPELPDYEPMPEEQSPRCCKCSGELEKPAEVASRRDESRDVWLMRFGLDQALEAKEPRTVRLLPESNREYERIGYARYVPRDQLEDEEKESSLNEERAVRAEEKLAAAEKRVAELELALGYASRERDENWAVAANRESALRHLVSAVDRDGGASQGTEPIMQLATRAAGAINTMHARIVELERQLAEEQARKAGRDW